jgi:hypothetical protein
VFCLAEGFGAEGFIAVNCLCMQELGCWQGFTHGIQALVIPWSFAGFSERLVVMLLMFLA